MPEMIDGFTANDWFAIANALRDRIIANRNGDNIARLLVLKRAADRTAIDLMIKGSIQAAKTIYHGAK